MSKLLFDGESRVMRSKSSFPSEFTVTAIRHDEDTPLILLTSDTGEEFYLTDVDAHDTVERIERALSILPTSK